MASALRSLRRGLATTSGQHRPWFPPSKTPPKHPPRLTLWHSKNTRSLRILWTFEEMGLRRGNDYDLRMLTFPPRQHHPDFLERNPLGTVPWFEHKEHWEETPRASMSESCAAPLYVANLHNHPIALTILDKEYGSFLNWLHHADATLTFPQAVVMRYRLFEREKGLEGAADDYARWFHARLRLLNAALEDGRPFLLGERFSLADVCVAYALFNASPDGPCGRGLIDVGAPPLSERFKPPVADYLQRMMARPSWKSAQREQEAAAAEGGV